jgi:hypothetical protein
MRQDARLARDEWPREWFFAKLSYFLSLLLTNILHHSDIRNSRNRLNSEMGNVRPIGAGGSSRRGFPDDRTGASGEFRSMMPVIEYVHAIEGRLRVKVVEVKGSPEHARQVEALFAGVEGVREVRANPITGNVLFLHDPGAVAAREILGALIAAGYMGMGIDAGRERPRDVAEVATTVAELLAWVILRAWKGFNPGQDLVERLLEAAARFLLRLVAGQAAAAPA